MTQKSEKDEKNNTFYWLMFMKAPSTQKEVRTMDQCVEPQIKNLTDEQLVELYWQRNENAIKETEIKYGKMLFCIAYNILQDKSDCEECQNDAYLCFWNRIPPTRPASFRAFISKIIRDIAINKYNAKMCKKRIPSELTDSIEELCDMLHEDDTPYEEYLSEELGKLISNYVRGLSKRRHYIFIGRFYFGNSMQQIAEELGISIATVQRETIKLKKEMKAYLEKNEVYV